MAEEGALEEIEGEVGDDVEKKTILQGEGRRRTGRSLLFR
jgi:hypothetical protein